MCVGLAVGVTAWWGAAGAHRGWTQTSVPVKELDEVTGIEAIRYEERMVPGIDVLGGGWAVAGVGWVLTFVGARKKRSTSSKTE